MGSDRLKLLLDTLLDYSVNLEQEHNHCLCEWPNDLSEPVVRRVLTTLLARQTYFAMTFATNGGMWNRHTAALMLRPMLETHLKICWVLQKPLVRCHGIARADLIGALDKLTNLTEAASKVAQSDEMNLMAGNLSEMLRKELSLFDADQKAIMVESREMANKVGGEPLALYRRYHIRFSASVHSNWNHIARFNLNRDPNPLHRFQLVAMFPNVELNFEHALAAAVFADETLCLFRKSDSSTSLNKLFEDLEKIGAIKRGRKNQNGDLDD